MPGSKAGRRMATTAALGLVLLAQPPLHARQLPSPAQQQRIALDAKLHNGDAPTSPGALAQGLSGRTDAADVDRAMRKVGDWELARAQPWFGGTWEWSVLYSGFMAAGISLHDTQYLSAMDSVGTKLDWKLRSALPSADDQSIGQMYTEMYMLQHQPGTIAPTREQLNDLLADEKKPAARIPWWWCDALFMAPPVWVRMYAITHDRRYIGYVDREWWKTSALLYDPQEHLYFRDATYLDRTEPNGKKMFWSRGNGWVMAGLARTLEYLPKDDPLRPRYVKQFRQMAARVASLQGSDGLWRSGLLDPDHYVAPENSGSALLTYALAWGVHHHLLSRPQYEPVVARAWAGMVHSIYANGRLGSIQQTGAAPAFYPPGSSYNYGVGAFLLAGSEVRALGRTSKRRPILGK
jgi:unsaturated rhamnogalacturonyl hydrolase